MVTGKVRGSLKGSPKSPCGRHMVTYMVTYMVMTYIYLCTCDGPMVTHIPPMNVKMSHLCTQKSGASLMHSVDRCM